MIQPIFKGAQALNSASRGRLNLCRGNFYRSGSAVLILGVVLGSLALGSCRNSAPTVDGSEPAEPTAPATSEPVPDTPPDQSPEQSPDSGADAPPAAVEPAPQPTASTAIAPTTTQSKATLPDTLVQPWEPLSNVLLAFGAMTITPNQIQWANGQASSYQVLSTDGGYLLKLEAAPRFYDTPYPYIKLIPQAEGGGGSIDVAFYETLEQAQQNQYVMFGGYFIK